MVRATTHTRLRASLRIAALASGPTLPTPLLLLHYSTAQGPLSLHLYSLQVRGRDSLSAEDLLNCFDFAPGGDGAAGAVVTGFLREVVGSGLDEQQRWKLLRWATSRSTLPVNGLGQKVTLIRKDTDGAPPDQTDQWLPEAHTCSLEVALPDYSSSAALSEQLIRALEEMDAGGGFGLL